MLEEELSENRQYISGLGPGQLKALFILESGYSAKSSAGLKGLIRVHERNFGPSTDDKFWVHEHGRLSWLRKIIRPVLPMRKHSRAAPEPLGWRKRPWPFPPAGSSRAESATTVMFSCKPAGSLLGRPQAGAYVNSFPFQTHTPCSTAVDCPPLQAGTWGSSAECPCPFSSLSNLSAYTAPHPPTSNTPHIWRPSLPLCPFSSHLLGPGRQFLCCICCQGGFDALRESKATPLQSDLKGAPTFAGSQSSIIATQPGLMFLPTLLMTTCINIYYKSGAILRGGVQIHSLNPCMAKLEVKCKGSKWLGEVLLAQVHTTVSMANRNGFPGGTSSKEPTRQCKRPKRQEFDPWPGRPPVGGRGSPVQYSCLENPMDLGARQATVQGVTKIDVTQHSGTRKGSKWLTEVVLAWVHT